MSLWSLALFLIRIIAVSSQNVRSRQHVYRLPNAEVLATQPEVAEYGHTLRVAMNDGEQKAIKYIFLDSEILRAASSSDHEEIRIDLPHLPLGDWNEAHIHLDGDINLPIIANTTWTDHLGMMENWHPQKIDYLEFANVKTLQQDRLQVVTHPDFEAPVLIKIASFPWEIPSLEQEATIYRSLHGSGVTPEFLGHVTENGRVIGFITEYIREIPSVRDRSLQGCLLALRNLHQKGIAHGDAHDGNCLIRKNGSAVLIDFELSLQTSSLDEFERDLDIMGRCIQSYE